jgi:hypothetical protein
LSAARAFPASKTPHIAMIHDFILSPLESLTQNNIRTSPPQEDGIGCIASGSRAEFWPFT